MKRFLLVVLLLFASLSPAVAQTTASYAERAALAYTNEFQFRVQHAMIKVAIDVSQEAPTTTNHAQRIALAYNVVMNPDNAKRFAATVMAMSNVVVLKDDTSGTVYTTLTDAALYTLVSNMWTPLAMVLTRQ